jgi:hypothetical protein
MSLFYGSDKLISKSTIQTSLGKKMQIVNFPREEGEKLIESLKSSQVP